MDITNLKKLQENSLKHKVFSLIFFILVLLMLFFFLYTTGIRDVNTVIMFSIGIVLLSIILAVSMHLKLYLYGGYFDFYHSEIEPTVEGAKSLKKIKYLPSFAEYFYIKKEIQIRIDYELKNLTNSRDIGIRDYINDNRSKYSKKALISQLLDSGCDSKRIDYITFIMYKPVHLI